jgi:hypothetical protein
VPPLSVITLARKRKIASVAAVLAGERASRAGEVPHGVLGDDRLRRGEIALGEGLEEPAD